MKNGNLTIIRERYGELEIPQRREATRLGKKLSKYNGKRVLLYLKNDTGDIVRSHSPLPEPMFYYYYYGDLKKIGFRDGYLSDASFTKVLRHKLRKEGKMDSIDVTAERNDVLARSFEDFLEDGSLMRRVLKKVGTYEGNLELKYKYFTDVNFSGILRSNYEARESDSEEYNDHAYICDVSIDSRTFKKKDKVKLFLDDNRLIKGEVENLTNIGLTITGKLYAVRKVFNKKIDKGNITIAYDEIFGGAIK